MPIETISDLIAVNPSISFTQRSNKYQVLERFYNIIDDTAPSFLFGVLKKFIDEKPFSFWNISQVELALYLLEKDIKRSSDAISVRAKSINRGLDALYRQPGLYYLEDSLNLNRPIDLIKLSTDYLPQYLRWAEHIYSNFLEFFWAIIKKGSVEGKFQVKGAIAIAKNNSLNFLFNGYDDNVRNGIAHGDFSIAPFGIVFGSDYPNEISIVDFQNNFDNLVRTCNSLAIAILLFWSRHYSKFPNLDSKPISIISRLVAGSLDRLSFLVIGALESNTPLAGKQLHIAIDLINKKRQLVLMECARTAYYYLIFGAIKYDRFVIQINHQEPIDSMVFIDPSKFLELINNDSPIDDLNDAISHNSLLWFDEGKWKTRLKNWKEILLSGIHWVKLEILNNWHEDGILIGKGQYIIRGREIISSQGISRIRIQAVLKNPNHSRNRDIIKAILLDIVSKYKWKLIPSREKSMDQGIRLPKFPSYIWIDLFKEDGSIRWLKSGGWLAGNLVAVAEKISGNKPPIIIIEPEDIHKDIRIRYSINIERAAESYAKLQKVIDDIWKNRKNTG